MRIWKNLAILFLTAALLAHPILAAEAGVAPWAEEAVDFAVERGMMSPTEQRPRDSATRAELAHMIAALFNAETEDSLEGCPDVEPGAWYRSDMAKAVALGLYDGGKALNPRRALTREEVFLVLARCFGVGNGDRKVLSQFTDTYNLNEWAAGPVAGLIEAGYIQGTDGKLNPQGAIARQDLANLIYRLAGSVPDEDGTLPEQGNVVLPVGTSLSEGSSIHGNLIVCAGEEQLTLRDVTVSGSLVIHGGSVEFTGSAKNILCRGQGIRLSGETLPDISAAYGDLTIEKGTCAALTLGDASVRLETGVEVGRAELTTAFSVLSGEGKAEEMILRDPKASESLEGDPIQSFTAPVETVRIVASAPANEPKPEARNITTTVRFENTGEAAGTYILAWYMDGRLVSRDWTFNLTEGATATLNTTAGYESDSPENVTILARLSDGTDAAMLSQSVSRHLELLAPPVDTMHIEATVLYNLDLYNDAAFKSWQATIPAGTVVTYSDYRDYKPVYVTLPDGRSGYVPSYGIRLSSADFVQKEDYSTFQKERFVNETKHYQSDTNLLVWLSRRTQKVNVFEGSQDNWKLIHTFDCCSGKNSTPTVGGVFKYYTRTGRWDFGTYYVNKPMLFNGGHAFHTRTYIYGQAGVLLDATIGAPRSHGCVRMYDQDVDWLWNNMKMGTTVVVY